jgi:hypothetical protein
MSRPPCICYSLHNGCDPRYCDEATSIGVDRGFSHQAFEKPVKLSFSREDLARVIEYGCPTCEVLHIGIASSLAQNTSLAPIQVRRGSDYLTVEHHGWSVEYFQEAQSGKFSAHSRSS